MMQYAIDRAKSADISYLKDMWENIFGDTREYTDLYFSYKFKEGNVFVIREDEKIVSTLYVEYNDVFIEGEIYKGAYFCGIATLKDYRKRGYAKKLIDYAKKNINKVDIIYLIPANLPLFEFYKECGFEGFTFLDKVEVLKENISLPLYKEEFDYEKLNKFYENSKNNLYIKRDERFFKAIYECYKNIMIFDDGYVIYYLDNGILHLVEYSFDEKKTTEILKGILFEKNIEKGILYKKWGNTPFSVCITDIDIKGIPNKYLNLMLN